MIGQSEMEKKLEFYVSSFDGLRAIEFLVLFITCILIACRSEFLGLDIFLIFSGVLYDEPNDKFDE